MRPGESLWSIAEDRLASDATDVEIADEVQRLWELNAERLGLTDPDVIQPGLRLRV